MATCTCGCSPCRCVTASETSDTECEDPGIVTEGAYSSVFNEGMCDRRLLPFRGTDGEGEPITDTEIALKHAVQVQDDAGNVKWSEEPCYEPPTKVVKVANDVEAAVLTNYIPYVEGKEETGCERRLMGSADIASGQWKMVWIASLQMWTTVPDVETELPDLCTTLVASFVLDPANVAGYLIQLLATEHLAVGVSVIIAGYELVVTEIIDSEYVRVVQVTAPAAPVTIDEGETVCNIGFRPCPQSEEPYADTIPGCFENRVIALTVPVDVNGMAVPGLLWRNQLGTWSFLAAPVDAGTGIVDPDLFLATPTDPAASVANLPSFRAKPGFTFITPVTIFSQVTGGYPTNDTQTITLSGTAGFVVGSTAALISIDVLANTTTAIYQAYIKINGIIRAHVIVGTGTTGSAMYNGPFLVPLDATSEVDVEVEYTITVAGNPATGFTATVHVNGYFG